MATQSSILAWKFYEHRSLTGYSPWGCKELDMTEQLTHIYMYRYRYIQNIHKTPITQQQKPRTQVKNGQINKHFSKDERQMVNNGLTKWSNTEGQTLCNSTSMRCLG